MDIKTIMGCMAVFGSAFCFYIATVLLVMGIGGQKIKIVKKRLLIGRALGNCLAVYCFFIPNFLTRPFQG